MSINIKEFNQLKAKKLARILEKTAENIVIAFKQYDLEQAKFGVLAEKSEEVAIQSVKELKDRKLVLQTEIIEIDDFLALTVIETKKREDLS